MHLGQVGLGMGVFLGAAGLMLGFYLGYESGLGFVGSFLVGVHGVLLRCGGVPLRGGAGVV